MENPSFSIESEYIRNLQQQVYFLELEANFLREQAKKTTSLQPGVALEMEHMLQKLRELQSQSDGLQLEFKRKENHLNMQLTERERVSSQIHVADEQHSRDKQALVEEIIKLKREKLQKDRQTSAKEIEILHMKQDLEEQQMNLNNSEQTILILQAKVKQRLEQQKVMEMQALEKRAEFLKLQSNVHAMEDKIFKKTAAQQEHLTHELRNEISFLHQQIRQRELQEEQNRLLRSKMMDDYEALTKENATLQARLLELSKQMDIERVLKEEKYTSHTASIAQFLATKDHLEDLQRDIKRHQELLEKEEKTFQELQGQINILGNRSTSLNSSIATISSQVAEMRALLQKEELKNLELKRDKTLLVDLITTLEKKLAGNETSFLQTSTRMLQLDEAISALKTKHVLRRSLEYKRGEEISKMANSMKKLSESMTDTVAKSG